jgi:hypothetical protein
MPRGRMRQGMRAPAGLICGSQVERTSPGAALRQPDAWGEPTVTDQRSRERT